MRLIVAFTGNLNKLLNKKINLDIVIAESTSSSTLTRRIWPDLNNIITVDQSTLMGLLNSRLDEGCVRYALELPGYTNFFIGHPPPSPWQQL